MNDPRSPTNDIPDNQDLTPAGQDKVQNNAEHLTGQYGNTLEPGGSATFESHEERQKTNMVNAENQAGINSASQNDQMMKPAQEVAEPLLSKEMVNDVLTRWNAIQFQFVDSPCSAIEQGDTLVADLIEQINRSLSTIQDTLNQRWINHDDISTEDLRLVLQTYRSILNRLLTF